MRPTRLLAAAPALALGLAVLPAAAEPYVMDKAHAQVTFRVDHLGFSMVTGWFREFDAEIDFDPDAIEESSVAFTIQADSVDTGWPDRDEHIRGEDFLHVEEHPEITFVSKEVELTSENTAEVTGDVTIRGATNEETFEVTLNNIGPSPFNEDQTIAGFTVTGEIDRTAYGVSFAAPAVGVTIPVRIDLEASPAE
ncbi:MAG: YceI family protein [Pseudomonadota bacterium]